MRKDNIENKFRFVLGHRAKEITVGSCPAGEIPSPEHLEAGIERLQSENFALEAVNRELKANFDRLDARYEQFLAQHRLASRNEVMMLGQIVRELHVFRQILIVSTAASNDEAERLMDKALPAIMEMRGTLVAWRAREGIEVPEYEVSRESQALEQLIQNPAIQRPTEKEIDPNALSHKQEKER